MKKDEIHMEGLSIETAFVYDFTSHGENFSIDVVDPEYSEAPVCIFTKELTTVAKRVSKEAVAVCIDENRCVIGVYQVSNLPSEVTKTGALVVFQKLSYEEMIHKFKKGDIIRYKIGVNYVEWEELLKSVERFVDRTVAFLTIRSKEYATVTSKEFLLTGTIQSRQKKKTYGLRILYGNGMTQHEMEVAIKNDSDSFEVLVPLILGANYIDCSLIEDDMELFDTKSSHIVFYKEETNQPKELIMWAEQYVNANVTNSIDKLQLLNETAKDAGITAFALDVKGVEGYASYRKASRTQVPYMTASVNPAKQIQMDIDFLEEFINIAHKYEIKVYASFNFFAEGNIASNDFAIDIKGKHRDWAEVLSVPEDNGVPTSVLDTKRNCMLCYVNPSNPEVQQFELERVKEVLDHYEVDAVIMDRTRYDNQYADFSDLTKEQFIEFLKQKGKELKQWPSDVYSFDQDTSMVFGPCYFEFLEYRSYVIKDFARQLRLVINDYSEKQNREIALAAYVGSWYDLYYQNGVNWGSSDFIYNERLNFPLSKLYTKDYAKTSYLDSIDFIMIGCYYETSEMIEKYTTIGNIVTNHQVPVIASLSLPHLTTQEALNVGAKACLEFSDGVMIFDLCYTNWEKLKKAL